jgi:integrase/recombinase XerD
MTRRELDPWVEGYLRYLGDMRRMASRTIVDVRCTLKKVNAFMQEQRPKTPLWKLGLDDYLLYISHEREAGSSENVLAKQVSHVRGLLDYAWRSGRSDRNVLDGFSLQDAVRRSPPRVLTIEETRQLVAACSSTTPAHRRDRLVILLLYGCGLRTSELCGIDVQDVDLEKRELFVKKGKGDRQRTIPVPSAVWTELLAYLAERGGRRGPLMRTHVKRSRISANEVAQIVKAIASRASLSDKVTPRTLRHTFATHLMDRGVDLAVIASLMGHRTPAETGVYLHVLPGRTQAAVRSLLEEEGEKQ